MIAYVPQRATADAAIMAYGGRSTRAGSQGRARWRRRGDADKDELELAQQDDAKAWLPLKRKSWSLPAGWFDPQRAGLRVHESAERRGRLLFTAGASGEQPVPDDWIQGPRSPSPSRPYNSPAIGRSSSASPGTPSKASMSSSSNMVSKATSHLAEQGWADYFGQAARLTRGRLAAAAHWRSAPCTPEIQSPGIGIEPSSPRVSFCSISGQHAWGARSTGWKSCSSWPACAACCVELFVLPGTAVFGLGGGLMIIVSLVLASRDVRGSAQRSIQLRPASRFAAGAAWLPA